MVTALLPALLLATPAGAASAQPAFSLTLSDGVEQVRSGDELDYVATVRNESAAAGSIVVTLTPPGYVSLESAGEGTVTDGAASWSIDLAAGESRELVAVAAVGEIPADQTQAVTMVAVTAAGSTEVLARTADSNGIDGVEAPEPLRTDVDQGPADETFPWWWIVAPGVAVLVAAAVVWLLLRSSSGRGRHARGQ